MSLLVRFLIVLPILAGCASLPTVTDADREDSSSATAIVEVSAETTPAKSRCKSASASDHELSEFTDRDCNDEGVVPVVHPNDDVLMKAASATPSDSEAVNPVPNAWDRVRAGITFEAPDDRRVRAQRNWYLRNPDYMQRMSNRAQPFLHYILAELERHNMPIELALLPIVESAYDPFAFSHRTASGMWQFIPGTGRAYDMKQSWWYDGRRDVVVSTRGAIRYLQHLRDFFDGNWLHALAAYNSGEGRVKRAIRYNKRRGRPTDFWSLRLPRETRAYVPKLLALADIIANQEKYDFTWPYIADKQVVEVVNVGSQIDLALAAELAGLETEALYALNPGFSRWATDPDGPHHLLLPVAHSQRFSDNLAQSDRSEWVSWVRHPVTSGDTLARLANRYETQVSVIQQINQLPTDRIYADDELLIPVSMNSLDEYPNYEENLFKRIRSTKQKIRYRVRYGDSLWEIARAFGVSINELAKWNNLDTKKPLYAGKRLVIELGDASSQAKAVTYRVRRGDSLSVIAARFNVRLSDLTRWNGINPKHFIRPGQKLTIYVSNS